MEVFTGTPKTSIRHFLPMKRCHSEHPKRGAGSRRRCGCFLAGSKNRIDAKKRQSTISIVPKI
jgi:hypothetical protein